MLKVEKNYKHRMYVLYKIAQALALQLPFMSEKYQLFQLSM